MSIEHIFKIIFLTPNYEKITENVVKRFSLGWGVICLKNKNNKQLTNHSSSWLNIIEVLPSASTAEKKLNIERRVSHFYRYQLHKLQMEKMVFKQPPPPY